MCSTKADYLLFEGRNVNRFWRIKSVAFTGATVHPHGVIKFLVKLAFDNKDTSCWPNRSIDIGEVGLEGPASDEFVDPANPWKNAFVLELSSRRSGPLTIPN